MKKTSEVLGRDHVLSVLHNETGLKTGLIPYLRDKILAPLNY